jgi:hypothetical protein
MKQRQKSASCSNCNQSFDVVSNFCPNCGQENHTHKLPIKHFLFEFIESLTHFDAKVFLTLKEMVAQPGLVTKNYNSNMRARYVPPARIYIFMSFIFFFLISVLYNKTIKEDTKKLEVQMQSQLAKNKMAFGQIGLFHKTRIDSVIFRSLITLKPITNTGIDSLFKSKNIETDWINTRIVHTFIKITKGEASISDIYFKFIKYISYSILILMPFFALILKLFYRKLNLFYSEFLVFSIYFHTFIFAVLVIFILFNKFIYSNDSIITGVLLSIFIYLGISLRKVFQQPIGRTIVKTILMSLIYSISLMVLALAIFIVTFL